MPTDEKTLHLRITTQKEVRHKKNHQALGINPDPSGKTKMIVDNNKYVVPTASPYFFNSL